MISFQINCNNIIQLINWIFSRLKLFIKSTKLRLFYLICLSIASLTGSKSSGSAIKYAVLFLTSTISAWSIGIKVDETMKSFSDNKFCYFKENTGWLVLIVSTKFNSYSTSIYVTFVLKESSERRIEISLIWLIFIFYYVAFRSFVIYTSQLVIFLIDSSQVKSIISKYY